MELNANTPNALLELLINKRGATETRIATLAKEPGTYTTGKAGLVYPALKSRHD
jgi:hypothetical protein